VLSKAVRCSGITSFMAVKLSNSGDSLKLIVPSCIRKYICGQNNYLGMVTSYMMMETEMGYRGSKSSLFKYNSQPVSKGKGVKEQRVDGSWCFFKMKYLRCTLTGFERSYQVKIPSKQLFKRSYSTDGKTLNPNFVTGFTDAEGSFTISIYSYNKATTNIRVMARFKIELNEKDLPLLMQYYCKHFFLA
jgi:hypothetical protein